MSEHSGDEWAILPGEQDEAFDTALRAVCYRDAETALATFSLLEAAQLILHSLEAGKEPDRERLGRLVAAFHEDEPDEDAYYDEDGYLVVCDTDGNILRREESSPETMRYFREQKERRETTSAYVAVTSPAYVEHLQTQLAKPEATQGTLTLHVQRGRREGEIMSQNELALAALGEARDELRRQGLTVDEKHLRVGADRTQDHPRSELTHTLHTLTVSR